MTVWNEYSEKSARAKLARHRKRGDTGLSMVCINGMWHVGEFDVCPDCDGWGREYANGIDGTTRLCRTCEGTALKEET